MDDLLLHDATRAHLEAFLRRPGHALLLTGQRGSGKRTLGRALAAALIGQTSLDNYPYALVLTPQEGKPIGIEGIRRLEQFLSLKVPAQADTNRIVIIEDAHLLGHEAQNALLKTLEEPPLDTVIILTASHPQTLLPTIRSRVQAVPVQQPDRPALEKYFEARAEPAAVRRAYSISGGLPGLMDALLDDGEHPLLQATEQARQLLQQAPYERLLAVDTLAKDRTGALDVAYILQQMAHVSLQTATGAAARKWHKVLSASHEAAESLLGSAQPKLVLTRLMLSF